MKTLCTLLLALGTLCSIQAQERKVNQPPFIVRNTSTVEINQITLFRHRYRFGYQSILSPTQLD